MPMNPPPPPPTRTETVARFAGRHSEAVSLTVGFLLGVIASAVGALVR